MKISWLSKVAFVLCALLPLLDLSAETIRLDLHDAIERALNFDPRIAEKEKMIGVARGQLQEAEGAESWVYDLNFFLGLASKLKSNFFHNDGSFNSDSLSFDGVTPWYNLEFRIVRPLETFGKIEEYSKAAKSGIKIREWDVDVERAKIYIDVVRAYSGFLAARDIERFLHDMKQKLQGAIDFVKSSLEDGEGSSTESDLHALGSGMAIIERYVAQARGAQRVAMTGLRLVTGTANADILELADTRLITLPFPEESLKVLQRRAILHRPEMKQVEAGMAARRALVAAENANYYPNIYAGVGGVASIAPGRDRTDDFAVYDPFNTWGITPVVGIKWDLYAGVQDGRLSQAQAELDALIEKKAFAQLGIPFQVAEEFHEVTAHRDMIAGLKKASLESRRWMTAAYADFEAGMENSALTITALQVYVTSYGDYLRVVNDYNVHVASLWVATGELK